MLTKIKKSAFLRSSIKLITGTATVNLIPIIFQPFLRRVYSVEDFGAFGVYFSIVGMAVTFVSLRYPLAIYLPKRKIDAYHLVVLSWIVAFIISLILIVLIILNIDSFSNLIKFPSVYINYLYLLPLSIFLFSVYDTFSHWLIRKNQINEIIINKFSKRITESFIGLILGALSLFGGLFWSEIVGGGTQLITAFRKKSSGLGKYRVKKTLIVKLAKKYKNYPLYNSFPAFLNTVGMLLPIILINAKFSSSDAGFFDLTRLVLAVPISLVSIALSKIILQNISEKFRKNMAVWKSYLKVTIVLSALSILFVVIVLLFGPFLFGFFFGEKWLVSSQFSNILVFGFAIKFIVSPLSSILNAINKIKVVSVWQLFYFLLILVLALWPTVDVYEFIKLYVIIEIIAYSIYFILISSFVKKHDLSLN